MSKRVTFGKHWLSVNPHHQKPASVCDSKVDATGTLFVSIRVGERRAILAVDKHGVVRATDSAGNVTATMNPRFD